MSNKCLTCQLYCAAVKILCYQHCCCCLHKKKIFKTELHILALGQQCAGKSYLLAELCSEPVTNIEPTDGFSLKDILLERSIMHIKELGGNEKIRPYWHHYMNDTDGLIFVIDGSNLTEDKLYENKLLLHDVMENKYISNKPVLILLTKTEKKEEKYTEHYIEQLELCDLQNSSFTFEYAVNLDHTRAVLQNFANVIALQKEK